MSLQSLGTLERTFSRLALELQVQSVLERPGRPPLTLAQICRELPDVPPTMVEECLSGLLGSGRVERSYAVGYELGYRYRNKP